MLKLLLVLFVACAYGQRHQQLHSTCHCSRRDTPEEDVVRQIMAQLDLNKDGELNTGEVVVGMAHILGQDLSVSEEVILGMNEDALIALARLLNTVQVSEHDFVRTWHDTFGDCEDFSTALFRSFDANRDSILTIQEVEGILFHVRQVSGNLDGHITTQEFHDFFMWLYKVEGC